MGGWGSIGCFAGSSAHFNVVWQVLSWRHSAACNWRRHRCTLNAAVCLRGALHRFINSPPERLPLALAPRFIDPALARQGVGCCTLHGVVVHQCDGPEVTDPPSATLQRAPVVPSSANASLSLCGASSPGEAAVQRRALKRRGRTDPQEKMELVHAIGRVGGQRMTMRECARSRSREDRRRVGGPGPSPRVAPNLIGSMTNGTNGTGRLARLLRPQ